MGLLISKGGFMKYTYCQGKDGAWIEEYICTNYFCEPNCDCGLTFEEAKEGLVSYYEHQLENAKKIIEEDY